MVSGAAVTYRFDLPGGQQRLKEAIIYVAAQSQPMQFFGAIKLNKILWRADFRAFSHRRQPVTGRTYQRLRLGPAPIEMVPLMQELLREQCIRQETREIYGKNERRPVALVSPVMKFFSEEDVGFLNEAIQHYWLMTGLETSDESHGIAWKTRFDGDPIPYEASYLEDAELGDLMRPRLANLGEAAQWRSE